MYGGVPGGAPCDQCPHPAMSTVVWDPKCDGIHFTERAGAYLCDCCFLTESLRYAEKQAARLPELREKLAQACRYDKQHGDQEDSKEDHPRLA